MMRIWQNKSRAMVVTVCLALLATPVIIDQVAKQVPSQAGVWDVTSALRYDSEGTIIGAPLQDLDADHVATHRADRRRHPAEGSGKIRKPETDDERR